MSQDLHLIRSDGLTWMILSDLGGSLEKKLNY